MEFSITTIDKVESTQNYLIELSNKSELQEGVVINALSQFKGVGQFDNRWESEDGKNLTFSSKLPVDTFLLLLLALLQAVIIPITPIIISIIFFIV